MILITIVHGVYKPTYNWGAPPCRYIELLTMAYEPTNITSGAPKARSCYQQQFLIQSSRRIGVPKIP